jgi:hypothetical protein
MVAAQSQLPAPTRTIYKCELKGAVTYSDDPCVGAKRLDVSPTRGVNRLAGSARTGKDVAREIRSEQFAQAFEPISGMNASQFATATRRVNLSAGAQRECRQLEAAIVETEQAEKLSRAEMVRPIQQELFVLRKRYKALSC